MPALEKFPPEKALEYFHSLGLVTVEEYGGRVYPLSNSANSVLDVLRFALEQSGVEVKSATSAREIYRDDTGWAVVTDGETLHCDKLIVACGGAAGAKLGGVSDGYDLLKPLGHKRTGLYPSLVQLITEPEYPRSLKGVRADCRLRLFSSGEALTESRGELQFTDNGVSGPAAFDVSRAASTGGRGLSIEADFFADYSVEAVTAMLCQRREKLPELTATDILAGMLHNRLGKMLVKYTALDANAPIKTLTDRQLTAIVKSCKGFRLKFLGTEGFDNAQVTAGGIRTGGFNPETLESWFMPSLFVCGELLDIDGDCGGYNLQWAWASGRLAGRLGL